MIGEKTTFAQKPGTETQKKKGGEIFWMKTQNQREWKMNSLLPNFVKKKADTWQAVIGQLSGVSSFSRSRNDESITTIHVAAILTTGKPWTCTDSASRSPDPPGRLSLNIQKYVRHASNIRPNSILARSIRPTD